MSLLPFLRSRPRWQQVSAVLLVLVLLWVGLRPSRSGSDTLTFRARKGPLDIQVLVGGSIEALESQELHSEVRGEPVKILKIVDEGYLVTEQDVKTNKVLVELDSSKIQQNLLSQDITFQSTASSLTEAQQAFEIQINLNKTEVKAAEQKARFALMDLEKFLGAKITREVVDGLGLREELQSAVSTNLPSAVPARAVAVDFSRYARADLLEDGLAKQELRKRDDELLVARTAAGQAETKLSGTKRLFEKGFVTKSEMENDQIGSEQARLKVEAASTARDLFIRYEFPKQSEEFLSKYDEGLQGLIRARKEAVSKLAQSEARLRGAQGRFEREKRNLEEMNDQIAKCLLTAKTPGLVVYGGGNQRMFWGNQERIAVGSQVFERQAIITIPDPTKMGVTVGVHESHIKKVRKGLKVKITADAFPDEPLTGEVTKVGVLPDSENRWMNPDMKLYQTTIAIEGTREWLKPGMSAKIEIQVKRLDDVVYVPIQAVVVRDGRPAVYLAGNTRPLEVETGEFNDEFIEIKKGLTGGDTVLLVAPGEDPASNGGAGSAAQGAGTAESPAKTATPAVAK
jgi:multidrug resistance efflux pump